MKQKPLLVASLLFSCILNAQTTMKPLWHNNQFEVFSDRIVQQGKYTAKALSPTEMTSDYKSPANLFKSSVVAFKFSINGKDNEMKSGFDHHINLAGAGSYETPLIKFGEQLKTDNTKEGYLSPNTKLKIRLDLRNVFAAFKKDGYYTLFNGDKLYKDDFKAVYVAGSSAPLIWDFNNLHQHSELQLKDPDGDGIYETEIVLNKADDTPQTAASWKMSKDATAFPQYKSSYVLSDAIYNMSLEEMMKAVEPDSTFRTGKEWAGVWTRDISYSIILSMAYLQPRVAKNSLLRKVNKKKKIIQDTGTGGAWPVSSDRMIWAVAAYELYKATGDKDWLQEAYTIIKNSLEDDYQNLYDSETGLVKGESSFLDWREQTYPKWMQPADIYNSENLGTNAVHYEANVVAAKMAHLLHKETEAKTFLTAAEKIKTGINKYLWMPAKNYYGQYWYGRSDLFLSPKSEALGEALCVLFGIADEKQQTKIVSNVPQLDFGIPCIYPQIPDIPPYHNNAVWPFVQSYWLWASAKSGNEGSVMQSIASIYRPAAMFLTNKENFVADNGDFLGTQINSSNMLWSLSGNISIVHKVFFGIRFNEDGLGFEPFVPKAFNGKRSLTNFTYRDAVLNIEMSGYGNKIKNFWLDGKMTPTNSFPASLKGVHAIKIELANNDLSPSATNNVANHTSLPAPVVNEAAGMLSWEKVDGAVNYKIIRDGALLTSTTANHFAANDKSYAEYSVIAVDKKGMESFASEPLSIIPAPAMRTVEAEDFSPKSDAAYKGFSGSGFTQISTSKNTTVTIPINVSEDGFYLIDVKYANGNGPINTENKCAIRTAFVNDRKAGVFVFPQRGTAEWSNWGFSNSLKVYLMKGKNNLTLRYLPANQNMNEEINEAMLDYVRVIKLDALPASKK